MAKLRSPSGCPWDREQTHQSLKPYLLEEAYEVLEALDFENDDDIAEELGDLLLQVLFHAQIASEEKRFDIEDVIRNLNDKLIRRHPHVFGNAVITNADQQKKHWEKIKRQEGKASVLNGVPVSLPALIRAVRLQQKASTVGFDWNSMEPVMDKVSEELDELRAAFETGDTDRMTEELGDFLFSLANVSRFLRIDPEDALRQTCRKFTERFHFIEERLENEGKPFEKTTLEEMDGIWEDAKKKGQSGRN